MLQEHENEQVYQDAQALIEKYFETEVLLNFELLNKATCMWIYLGEFLLESLPSVYVNPNTITSNTHKIFIYIHTG